MRNALQKLSHKINTIVQYPGMAATLFNKVNREFCRNLLYIKQDLGFQFETILDVGAAIGEYSKAVRLVYPEADIYAFEPIPDSYKTLENVGERLKKMKCYNVALSDSDAEIVFHLNEFSFSSSLLKMTQTHKKIFPFTNNETTIKVKSCCLDNMFKQFDMGGAFLKMDVQGAELQVLKGATSIMKQIKAIQLEASFMHFYENQTTIEELIAYLKSAGFDAFLQINPVVKKHQLLFSDFIFWRSSYESL